jgi:hypothetical protein
MVGTFHVQTARRFQSEMRPTPCQQCELTIAGVSDNKPTVILGCVLEHLVGSVFLEFHIVSHIENSNAEAMILQEIRPLDH